MQVSQHEQNSKVCAQVVPQEQSQAYIVAAEDRWLAPIHSETALKASKLHKDHHPFICTGGHQDQRSPHLQPMPKLCNLLGKRLHKEKDVFCEEVLSFQQEASADTSMSISCEQSQRLSTASTTSNTSNVASFQCAPSSATIGLTYKDDNNQFSASDYSQKQGSRNGQVFETSGTENHTNNYASSVVQENNRHIECFFSTNNDTSKRARIDMNGCKEEQGLMQVLGCLQEIKNTNSSNLVQIQNYTHLSSHTNMAPRTTHTLMTSSEQTVSVQELPTKTKLELPCKQTTSLKTSSPKTRQFDQMEVNMSNEEECGFFCGESAFQEVENRILDFFETEDIHIVAIADTLRFPRRSLHNTNEQQARQTQAGAPNFTPKA